MSAFDWGVIMRALPFLWEGMKISLLLTAAGIAGGKSRRGGAEGADHSKGCQQFLFHVKPPFMARPTPRRGYVA